MFNHSQLFKFMPKSLTITNNQPLSLLLATTRSKPTHHSQHNIDNIKSIQNRMPSMASLSPSNAAILQRRKRPSKQQPKNGAIASNQQRRQAMMPVIPAHLGCGGKDARALAQDVEDERLQHEEADEALENEQLGEDFAAGHAGFLGRVEFYDGDEGQDGRDCADDLDYEGGAVVGGGGWAHAAGDDFGDYGDEEDDWGELVDALVELL